MADRKKFYPRELADDLPDDLLPGDFFVVPGTDDKGHSTRVQFRCAPELDRQADEIVASRQFPFKTRGDLCRFAYFEACRRLLRYSRNVPNILGEIEIINAIVRRKQRHAAFEDSVRALQTTIDDLQKIGADGEIAELMREVDAQVRRMSEVDSYWGDRYRQEMERRWGALRREIDVRLNRNPIYIDFGAELRKHRNGQGQ